MSNLSFTGENYDKSGESPEGLFPLHDENKNININAVGKAEISNALSAPQTACFPCQKKDLPDIECKACQNIRLYRSKNGEHSFDDREDIAVSITFPGPGIVKRNHIYGNYVVASRAIQPGELLILEKPLTTGPYGPTESLPLCLSCCKDIGVSSKCSRCNWPVCDSVCEKFYLHAENECDVFSKCKLKPKGILNEYFGVETLRSLLLRTKSPSSWKRILEFEPHNDARSNDYRAKAVTDFIIRFIRDKCHLSDQFTSDEIVHVVGVLSVNTFWALKDLNRYASCLFDKITLLAHDCDPNTERKMVFLGNNNNDEHEQDHGFSKTGNGISTIALQISASREIAAGEMITTRYIDLNQPLAQRREELKETFYFDCTCSRCLREMIENEKLIVAKLMETNIL